MVKIFSKFRFIIPQVALSLRHPLHRRRGPAAVKDLLSRPVDPHDEVEPVFRGRQPVGFFFFSRRLVLDIKVQGTVGVELQFVPVADGITAAEVSPFLSVPWD
jgi:hypothetical protein